MIYIQTYGRAYGTNDIEKHPNGNAEQTSEQMVVMIFHEFGPASRSIIQRLRDFLM